MMFSVPDQILGKEQKLMVLFFNFILLLMSSAITGYEKS